MIRTEPITDATALELKEMLRKDNIFLIEYGKGFVKNTISYNLTLASPDGLDMHKMAKYHKLIYARLCLDAEDRDVTLNISSPGIGRKIKNINELEAFIDENIQIMPDDINDWVTMKLKEFSKNKITGITESGTVEYEVNKIIKIRLS